MKLARTYAILIVLLALVMALFVLTGLPSPVAGTPTPERPTIRRPFDSAQGRLEAALRPTFPFPTGQPVPITSADGVLIDSEAGPLYVMLSTVDEHGLAGEPTLDLMSRPDPADMTSAGSVPSGSFVQVLEIRRLPPDYLRTFYRVAVLQDTSPSIEGWVGDWHVRRTVFVIAFDEQGCACAFRVSLWANAQLTQPAAFVANRAPLRLLALVGDSVRVQILSDGTIGWLDRGSVHESQDNEFIRQLSP